MHTRLMAMMVVMTLCIAAPAQTIRPVKDKVSKKFGYQDKSKNWVIAPAFDAAKNFSDGHALVTVEGRDGLIDMDGNWILPAQYDKISVFNKNGLCELMIKEGKTKFHGVADRGGNIVLPVEFREVDLPDHAACILASYSPDGDGTPLWGVWDLGGRMIFEPQFLSSPSASGGTLIARNTSGLYGVGDLDGNIVIPFDFLAISRYSNGFQTLDKNFTQAVYSSSFRRAESFIPPHAVIPYDPMDDLVRAAAWHSGCIGQRLHANQVKLLSVQTGYGAGNAYCSDLPVDWGKGRFIRLEPFATEDADADSMTDPVTGKPYTLKALLYEADGTLVRKLCDKGWLEAECAAGVIYNAGGRETWLVLHDSNALGFPSYTLSLAGSRTIAHDNVCSALGIRSYDLERLAGSVRNFADRCVKIYEGENLGITSYVPPVIDIQDARMARDVMRGPVWQHAFRMGEVVSCDTRLRAEGLEVTLHGELVCHFEDHFKSPYYTSRGEEVIWWGPHNARTVRLNLLPTGNKDALADDVAGTGRFWDIELALYEEDGTWLRTLGRAPFADFTKDGILIFNGLKIALLAPGAAKEPGPGGRSAVGGPGAPDRIVLLKDALPLPHTVSALNAFRLHNGPGPGYGPAPAPGPSPRR